jgi:hypothetical protein
MVFGGLSPSMMLALKLPLLSRPKDFGISGTLDCIQCSGQKKALESRSVGGSLFQRAACID